MIAKLAANVLLAAMSALTVFHVLVIVRVRPSGIVRGGQAGASSGNPVVLETTILLVTLVFTLILAGGIGPVGVPGEIWIDKPEPVEEAP